MFSFLLVKSAERSCPPTGSWEHLGRKEGTQVVPGWHWSCCLRPNLACAGGLILLMEHQWLRPCLWLLKGIPWIYKCLLTPNTENEVALLPVSELWITSTSPSWDVSQDHQEQEHNILQNKKKLKVQNGWRHQLHWYLETWNMAFFIVVIVTVSQQTKSFFQ